MSTAHECDLCGVLYKPEPGCLSIESLYIVQPDDGDMGWSDLDYCKPCSDKIVAIIHPSLVEPPG